MFEVGRFVCYRAEGVCQIVDIREETFGKGRVTYYVLSPVQDVKSTVYVPVDNPDLTARMRKLLSAKEICELVDSLRNERMEWISESRSRNARFREILGNGERSELIVLILTVMDHWKDREKKMSIVDENAVKRAKRLLLEEFSVTTDLSTEEDLIRLLQGEATCHDRDAL